mgnify:CR=1 FL=1
MRIKNEELENKEISEVKKILETKIVAHLSSQRRGDSEVKANALKEDHTHQAFPIVALTATATEKVRADIKERLGLVNPTSFITGFDRKNICIVVREISNKEEKQEKVLEIIDKTPGV